MSLKFVKKKLTLAEGTSKLLLLGFWVGSGIFNFSGGPIQIPKNGSSSLAISIKLCFLVGATTERPVQVSLSKFIHKELGQNLDKLSFLKKNLDKIEINLKNYFIQILFKNSINPNFVKDKIEVKFGEKNMDVPEDFFLTGSVLLELPMKLRIIFHGVFCFLSYK